MKTVLIADDEFDLLGALQTVLELEGYAVELCMDGRHALDRLPLVRPDVVITDIMMPHVSGLDLLRRMRQNDQFARTPVIVMSSLHPEGGRDTYGWNAFLQKPFTIEQLMRAVDEAETAS